MMKEPYVRVGIAEKANVSIHPLESGEVMVRDVPIGKGFHWESTRDVVLSEIPEVIEEDAGRTVIASIPVEAYLESVVSSEMNPDAPVEFLKAHAVISRSWVLGKIWKKENKAPVPNDKDKIVRWENTGDHSRFDVCADDHCQRFQGFHITTEAARNAVEHTRGIILSDEYGMPADCRFSKCCGGITELFSSCWEDVDYPYLQSHPDPWCDLSSFGEAERIRLLSRSLKDFDSSTIDFYEWSETVPAQLIEENIKKLFGIEIGDFLRLIPLKRGPSGRIITLLIEGSKRSVEIGKELMIRKVLSKSHLYSSAFNITNSEKNTLHLSGKGWGHGVGLCQIGAAAMAASGHDFRSILEFYYPSANITKLYE